jgi:predicted ATPase/class 3 adenylate cyclase
MKSCPNCSQVNPPAAKFCIECGSQLIRKEELKADSHREVMPKEYAQKLETARKFQTMQGERRIVTILFCDVKGSTSMAGKLDPEEWAEIMNQAFEYLIAPIYEYEGTLARLMGDSVLAFFGAPIAHEDDARRAVLAGMKILESIQPFKNEIKQRFDQDFDVRVGINTGLVVVGGVGSDLFMEYTALGDAINIAARMEQTAQPGTIQIWEDTYKLVAPYFETELIEGLELKGKGEGGNAYKILGRKEGQNAKISNRGFNAPLTGRSNEFDILKQAISSVGIGRGQIICLIGEAGLGKSRLLREMQQVWEESNTGSQPFGKLPNRWNQTTGVSYATSRPYGLIQRLIRNFIGASSSDTAERVRQRLSEALAGNDLAVPQAQIDLFEMILGIKETTNGNQLSGEMLKKAIYTEMLTVLERSAQEVPTVICIDDLHWSDPASAELILHLFQLADRLPILFVCAARPDRSSPAWLVKQGAETNFTHRYTEIILAPLPEGESSELVKQLLVGYELPQNIRRLILRKSDGNPFFIEEVVRTLIEDKVLEQDPVTGNWQVVADIEDIAIPDNLQTLLAARIDQLEESAKQVLQIAAVIGRSFHHQVLENINDVTNELENEINKLQRLGLILETEREPYLEYVFRLALTHETAYNTILLKNRREFHKEVGEAILELFPDRIDEFNPMLNHHFYQAQDQRAVHYSRLEGDAALKLYANQEAIFSYTKAIEATQWAESSSLDDVSYLFLSRGRAYELNSQFSAALENYQELETIAKEHQEKAVELAALIAQAQIFSVPSNEFNTDAGIVIVDKAKLIAEEIEDKAALAKILWIETNLYRFHQSLEAAQEIGEKAIRLAKELGLEEQLAYSLNDTAHVYSMNGQVQKAFAVSIEAEDLWRKLGNQPMLADCLSGLATLSVYSGEFDKAYQYSDEAFKISKSIENVWGQAYSRYMIGLVDMERGDISKAIQTYLQSIRDSENSNFLAGYLLSRSNLSILYADFGDFASARQILQEVIDRKTGTSTFVEDFSAGASLFAAVKAGKITEAEEILKNYDKPNDDPHVIAIIYFVLAECYLHILKGEYEDAARRAIEFKDNLQKSGVHFLNAELLMLSGKAHLMLEEYQLAHDALLKAEQASKGIGSHRTLWQIYYYLGVNERQQGNLDEALGYFHQSQEIGGYILERIDEPEMKKLFLARVEIQSLADYIDSPLLRD